MTVNRCKAKDPRFQARWKQSGAMGNMITAKLDQVKKSNIRQMLSLVKRHFPEFVAENGPHYHQEAAIMFQGCINYLVRNRVKPTEEGISRGLDNLLSESGDNPWLIQSLVSTKLSDQHSLGTAIVTLENALFMARQYLT